MRCFTASPLPGTSASMQVLLHEPAYEAIRHPRRPCVIIFPGGAYRSTAEREAEPVGLAFLHAGFQVCILQYTTRPTDDLPFLGNTPMLEGAAAVRWVRANAAAWCVDPDKVIVCGFSAGGHAAGCTGVFWDSPHLPQHGPSSRPDAMVLCYPVLSGGKFAHRGSFFNLTGKQDACPENDAYSLERHVTPATPPTFLWHTSDDDAVPMENSLLMAKALHASGVPVELHLYTHGPHGLAMCTAETGSIDPHTATWFPLCVEWLDHLGLGPGA